MTVPNAAPLIFLILVYSAVIRGQLFTECGGVLERPSGAIVSPNYPSSYPNNAQCNWTITANSNEIINLKFIFLDLDGYEDSCPDIVNIYDGENPRSTPIQQMCRYKTEDELKNVQIRSTGNKMFVTFTSDDFNQRTGFFATYLTHVCPSFMYGLETCDTQCNCVRENTRYCDNRNGMCYCKSGWKSSRCEDDIDECADPNVERCPFDYKMCVNNNGSYTCRCKPGLIEFNNTCISNPDTKCSIECSDLCGITDDKIEHCYCPRFTVLNGTKCEACKPMTYGKSCSQTCKCVASNTAECDRINGQCKCKTGWYSDNCGLDVNECELNYLVRPCNSSQNLVCVNSPGSFSCQCPRGYTMNLTNNICERPVCDFNVTMSPSVVQSPNYPNLYWPNAVCTWRIQTISATGTVGFRITDFTTQNGVDNVVIYDGPNSNSAILGIFSGSPAFNFPIRSTTNSMFITFATDGWTEYSGYSGNYTESQNGLYPQNCRFLVSAAVSGQTINPRGYPRTRRIACYWSIIAPSGDTISISVTDLDTDPAGTSFLAIYSGMHIGDRLVGRYTGTALPRLLRLPGPVFIIYQSDEGNYRRGFKAIVNVCPAFFFGDNVCNKPCNCVRENTLSCNSLTGACSCKSGWTSRNCSVDINECLQQVCSLTEKCTNTPGSFVCTPDCDQLDLKGPFGPITTKNFPTYSLQNAVCNWKITGQDNEVVTLSIQNGNFQLVERAFCTFDSLDIYNSEVTRKNQIGKYCSNRIPGLIRTTSNKMILQLRTSTGSRKGFSGFYSTHACSNFTFGPTCNKNCSCIQTNTKFCDSISGVCVCKAGWTGEICNDDVNECKKGICPENNTCVNIPGGYNCNCLPGFSLNASNICVGNTDGCVVSKKNCSHFCTKTNNIVTCTCPEGMKISDNTSCSVELYPYGSKSMDFNSSHFDSKKGPSGVLTFSSEVPFGEKTVVDKAYIHNDGVISFGQPEKEDGYQIPMTLEDDKSKLVIKAFWNHLDRSRGEVYYHLYEKCEPSVFLEKDAVLSPDKQEVMDRAARDVIKLTSFSDFDVNLVIVATWEDVSIRLNEDQQSTGVENTFQAVFITGFRKQFSSDTDFSDEETSYALRFYPNGRIKSCLGSKIGVNNGQISGEILNSTCRNRFARGEEKQSNVCSNVNRGSTNPTQKCQRYVCKNSRQITNPVYREEIEQLYKCPCTLDRLGLQWRFFEQRGTNIYCFSITLVAKRKLFSSNPRNKLCCYKWNKPNDNSDWVKWAEQLALATFIHRDSEAGHIIAGDPEWYDGVSDNVNAHQWCCNNAQSNKLCERFDKIYPDMECSYDVEFVPGYLVGDPTIVTLDNVTYLMNGWGEYTLMDVPSENFTLQARTDRFQTSKGMSNGTVFTAFAAKDGYGTHFQVELSASKMSMEILAKGLNLTDDFYRQSNYSFSIDDIQVLRDNSGNKTKVLVSFPCGVSFIVRVGIKNLELEMQVVKTLKGKTKGLLGNFNGKTTDEFTLSNGTVLSSKLTEKQIFYSFANHYQVLANKSVFIYKKGKKATDYQHSTFVPTFMDNINKTDLKAAEAVCGTGRSACIYDYFITKDAAFAKNSDNTMKQAVAKQLLLANTCPNVTIVKNVNYTNARWFVQEGVVNTLRLNGTDANKDAMTYLLYENVTGVSINQTGFLNYLPSSITPVKIGFRLKDSKNCYTPVVNVFTAICPQCRNNGTCNRNVARNNEYFGGQVQILKCDCLPAYTGATCESEVNACLSKPCAKGKTCTDLTAAQQGNSSIGYVCGPCPKGYNETYELCYDIDECEDNSTCDHNCINTEGSFVCGCNTGYVLNRTDSRSCLAKNCSNRCIMQNTWYCDETLSLCVCKNNIQTPDCYAVVDHCISNSCPSNRKCRSNGRSYECACMNGLLPINEMCSDCNRILTEPSGSFMSSNFPDYYPTGESCTWTIISNDTNSRILLNFTAFDVEGCPYDYVDVYDGSNLDSNIIGEYCSAEDIKTAPISSSGNSLFVYFQSDYSVSRSGFFASYVIENTCRFQKCSHECKLISASPRVERCLCPEWAKFKDDAQTVCVEINGCNTTVTNSTGIIVSPGYPRNYHANVSCHWTIPQNNGMTAVISFSDMDIERQVSCPYDALKIYNGTSESYPLLGAYCGSSLPGSVSSSNSLYLVFTSDGSIAGRGFKLQYTYSRK